MAKKQELINILKKEYGYTDADLKNSDGKPLTNGQLELMIKKEEMDKDVASEEVVVAKRQKINDDDLIPVMNGLSGTLIHTSPTTGRSWIFKQFGQQEKIPYSELLSLRNRSPKVFNEGWLIILNRQVQEDFQLTEIYKNIITPDSINSVFDKNVDELRVFVDALPEGMKTTFFAIARERYLNKKLDSVAVVEFIENRFNISLKDNAPLNDIVEEPKEIKPKNKA